MPGVIGKSSNNRRNRIEHGNKIQLQDLNIQNNAFVTEQPVYIYQI